MGESNYGDIFKKPLLLLIIGGGLYYAYTQGWFKKKTGLKI